MVNSHDHVFFSAMAAVVQDLEVEQVAVRRHYHHHRRYPGAVVKSVPIRIRGKVSPVNHPAAD